MRVLVIDPTERTIREAEVDGIGFDQLSQIYQLIGGGCDIMERVPTRSELTIFVDEEGLYRQTAYWRFADYQQPLAGGGVVFGPATSNGDLSATTASVEEMRELVDFLPVMRHAG